MINPDVLARLPDAARAKAAEELDARIAAAIAADAKSVDVHLLLQEVEAATEAADAAAGAARALALGPLVEDVTVARRAMDDAAFKRDRLTEAAKRLGVRVDELKALEKDRAQRANHERVLAERNRLADEMGRFAEPLVQVAHLVRQIDLCDRQIGRLNATSVGLGYIRPTLAGAVPTIARLFQDAVVGDAFVAVAGLQAPPVAVVRGHQTANANDARQRPS
jgi:hypothetical protein